MNPLFESLKETEVREKFAINLMLDAFKNASNSMKSMSESFNDLSFTYSERQNHLNSLYKDTVRMCKENNKELESLQLENKCLKQRLTDTEMELSSTVSFKEALQREIKALKSAKRRPDNYRRKLEEEYIARLKRVEAEAEATRKLLVADHREAMTRLSDEMGALKINQFESDRGWQAKLDKADEAIKTFKDKMAAVKAAADEDRRKADLLKNVSGLVHSENKRFQQRLKESETRIAVLETLLTTPTDAKVIELEDKIKEQAGEMAKMKRKSDAYDGFIMQLGRGFYREDILVVDASMMRFPE